VGALGDVGGGLKDPEVNPIIIPYSLGLYLITNIQHPTAAYSSSATSAHVPVGSASSAGAGAPPQARRTRSQSARRIPGRENFLSNQ